MQLSDPRKLVFAMLCPVIAATLAVGFMAWPAAAGPVDGEWAYKSRMSVDPVAVAWIDIAEDSYVLRAKTGSVMDV